MEGAGARRAAGPCDDRPHRLPCGLPRDGGGVRGLRKRDRATKDTTTDIDSLTPEQREAQLDDLELRDISDHKLRKVLRDLDLQTSRLSQDDQTCKQGEATAI